MPCLNPDGTLTPTARTVLETLEARGCTATQLAARTDLPHWRIRAAYRELSKAELLELTPDGLAHLTVLGSEALEIDRTA